MTHKMLELIWRTESLQYVVCSLDLKKWRIERLKFENIFFFILAEGKKVDQEQQRLLILTSHSLSDFAQEYPTWSPREISSLLQ